MKYEREITDEEIKILEHHVLDVTQWIDAMIAEKIASCKKRLLRREIESRIETGAPLPISGEEMLKACFCREGYKNRKQREEEAVEIKRGKSAKAAI